MARNIVLDLVIRYGLQARAMEPPLRILIVRALPGVLSNVVAGLSIIFTRPFRVGECIEIAGEHRSRVVIPNRKIVGEIGAKPRVLVTDVVAAEAELYRAMAEHVRGRGIARGRSAADVRLVNGAPAAMSR